MLMNVLKYRSNKTRVALKKLYKQVLISSWDTSQDTQCFNFMSWPSVNHVPVASKSRPVHTYSLVLLGALDMGYLGVALPLGQDAASMQPPTTARKAPAQEMNMAEPNSYLEEKVYSKTKTVNRYQQRLPQHWKNSPSGRMLVGGGIGLTFPCRMFTA